MLVPAVTYGSEMSLSKTQKPQTALTVGQRCVDYVLAMCEF